MFSNCSSLTKLDLKSFNTTNVTKMNGEIRNRGIFSGCTNLTDLDISSFDTSNISVFFINVFLRCKVASEKYRFRKVRYIACLEICHI